MRALSLKVVGFTVLCLLAAAALFLLLFDFHGLFERRASAAFGRPVTVATLHAGIFPLRFVVEGFNVADKDSADATPLLHAANVDAGLRFWPLFAGQYVFQHLAVSDAQARVGRQSSGATNWDENASGKPFAALTRLPEIHDLSLHNARLTYSEPAAKTELALTLETRQTKDGDEPTLSFNGKGSYQGAPTTVTLTAGSVLALREGIPYAVDLKMTSGATEITAKGHVADPVHLAGLDIALTVKGTDASDLYRIAGVALPPTPPFQIVSHVTRDGQRWMLTKLTWKMGETDLAGDLTWDLSKDKPRLDGKLHAEQLDLDDMAGFIGAAPGKAKTPVEVKEAAADRERAIQVEIAPPVEAKAKSKAEEMASQLVIPDTTLDLQKINAMNAAVTLTAAHTVNAGFPLDNLTAAIALQDGVLTLKPLSLGTGKGNISVDLTLNAADRYLQRTDVIASVHNYPLQRLVGDAGENTTLGAMGGRIEIHGEGDFLHRILATSNGTFGLIAQGGQVSDLTVQMVGLNLARALGLLLSGDKPVPIRCMAADFSIAKGTMTSRALVFDTEPSIVTGDGTVDLATEVMKVKLHPKPKSAGFGTLRGPFHVSGTFADPSIGPDGGALALRGGAAAVLGVLLTPLGSLLATIDGGGGKDADCAALMAQVQQDSKKN